jgi:hypothetical protein
LDAETGPPKSPPETADVKGAGTDSGNPGTNGLLEPDWENARFGGLRGGHDRGATSELYQILTGRCGLNPVFEP